MEGFEIGGVLDELKPKGLLSFYKKQTPEFSL